MVWWQYWTYQDCNTPSIHELRIRDLLGLLNALVGGVADTLHCPFALVLRVVDHGCLPFTFHRIIPASAEINWWKDSWGSHLHGLV